MLDDKDLYILINLVDLHNRTSDPELGCKIKELANKVLDNLNQKEKGE